MTTNPLKQGALSENSAGIGALTPEMVRERAVELALINGHSAHQVSVSDWEQAKRELRGELEIDPNEAALEAAPESDRWDPVHGSIGHKTAVTTSEDEDEDGRSDSEILVEEGVNEAGHDQMLQAARNQREEDET